MNLTIEQLENIYNYIANRSNKDTSFPISSYEDLNMFTGLNKENKNVLFKKEIIDNKFDTITSDYIHRINNLSNFLQSEITDIKDNYIKKGDSNKTFILDNGERQSAIVDVDDEVEYNDDSINISLISSNDNEHPTIHIDSATDNQAGLMSAVDKKTLDNVTQDGGDAEFNSISNVEHISGNEEGLNISNVNGVNALNGGSDTEFWNTNGGKTNVRQNGLTTNGDIKIEGNNNITTVNKDGGILIYNKNKGINTIDLNGNNGKITLLNNTVIGAYGGNLILDKVYVNTLGIQNTSTASSNITMLKVYDDGLHIDKKVSFLQGLFVEDNKEASFGSHGILLRNGGINFKYSTNESHLVHAKSVDTNYVNGVACKENFYVKDNLYANSVNSQLIDNVKTLRFNDSNSELEIIYDGSTDLLSIGSPINITGYIKAYEYYVPKNHAIDFIYGDNKETSISADVNNGSIIMDKINCTNISTDGIDCTSDINISTDNTKTLIIGGDSLTFADDTNDNACHVKYDSDKNVLNVDSNIIAPKFISSSTTDKVTESTSISNTDVVVSYNGNNNSSAATLSKDSLTINSEDGFNGISKAIYTANSISISNTDNDGAYTNTIELSAIDNSIRFITKTSDNKTTSYKFNIQKAIELGLLTKE